MSWFSKFFRPLIKPIVTEVIHEKYPMFDKVIGEVFNSIAQIDDRDEVTNLLKEVLAIQKRIEDLKTKQA